eukprot:6738555-Prymnesium_polylepis.1
MVVRNGPCELVCPMDGSETSGCVWKHRKTTLQFQTRNQPNVRPSGSGTVCASGRVLWRYVN